jgi:hypothetical protein
MRAEFPNLGLVEELHVGVPNIALSKHKLVKLAAILTMIGLVCRLVSLFSSSLIR